MIGARLKQILRQKIKILNIKLFLLYDRFIRYSHIMWGRTSVWSMRLLLYKHYKIRLTTTYGVRIGKVAKLARRGYAKKTGLPCLVSYYIPYIMIYHLISIYNC